MRRLPRVIVVLMLLGFGGAFFLARLGQVKSALVGHVVISEVQVIGQNGAEDEFVELHNPSGNPVVMNNWRLTKRSSTGASPLNIVDGLNGTIPAHGYYLLAHPDYSGLATPDAFYTATSSGIPSSGSVTLYSDAGSTVVDLVGLGTSAMAEGAPVANPILGESVERKAKASSIRADMMPGGMDALEGNGEDSDSNTLDFIVRLTPQPQNSLVREAVGDANYTTAVVLNGNKEVPPVSTSGTGVATVEVVTALNQLSYVLTYQDLSGVETVANIRGPADQTATANVLTTIMNGTPKQGAWQYIDELEDEVTGGLTYFNIQTFTQPDGEIRGQIAFVGVTPAPSVTPGASPTPTTGPSPTVTPTVSPSLTPSPTLSATPTEEPSATPSPSPSSTPTVTITVTPNPTTEPIPTLTVTPTPTPTVEPTVTPSPSEGPVPTATLSPTPTPSVGPTPPPKSFRFFNVVCTQYRIHYKFFGRTITFPHIVCR